MTKVVVFDFDGTLTKDQNCWYQIWRELGLLDIDNILYSKFRRGELTFAEWMTQILNTYKEYKLSQKTVDNIAKNIKLIKGIEDVFCYLESLGIKIYILSSGIKNIITTALCTVKGSIQSIEAHTFIYDKDGFLTDFKNPEHDLDNKDEFVNIVLQKTCVNPSELLYVGNDWNDETVYKTGCNTLCLNAEEADYNNKTIWHNHIETDNLKDILSFIEIEKRVNL